MTAKDQPKGKAKSFGENIESDLALEMLRVVEIAAIESARTMSRDESPEIEPTHGCLRV